MRLFLFTSKENFQRFPSNRCDYTLFYFIKDGNSFGPIHALNQFYIHFIGNSSCKNGFSLETYFFHFVNSNLKFLTISLFQISSSGQLKLIILMLVTGQISARLNAALGLIRKRIKQINIRPVVCLYEVNSKGD
jgi:hypothetical protein